MIFLLHKHSQSYLVQDDEKYINVYVLDWGPYRTYRIGQKSFAPYNY